MHSYAKSRPNFEYNDLYCIFLQNIGNEIAWGILYDSISYIFYSSSTTNNRSRQNGSDKIVVN